MASQQLSASSARWNRIRQVRASFDVEVESRVAGGFPVVAVARRFGDQLESVTILTENFSPASFIERRMSDQDWDRVYAALSGELQ